jgi:hypothetical protein
MSLQKNNRLSLPPFQVQFGSQFFHYLTDDTGKVHFSAPYGNCVPFNGSTGWTNKPLLSSEANSHPVLWTRDFLASIFSGQKAVPPNDYPPGFETIPEIYYGKKNSLIRAPRCIIVYSTTFGSYTDDDTVKSINSALNPLSAKHNAYVAIFDNPGDKGFHWRCFSALLPYASAGYYNAPDDLDPTLADITNVPAGFVDPTTFVGGVVYEIILAGDDAELFLGYAYPSNDGGWKPFQNAINHDVAQQKAAAPRYLARRRQIAYIRDPFIGPSIFTAVQAACAELGFPAPTILATFKPGFADFIKGLVPDIDAFFEANS